MKTDVGNQFHSEPYFFDADQENFQIISAKEKNAYPGVEMHRTLALITSLLVILVAFRMGFKIILQLD